MYTLGQQLECTHQLNDIPFSRGTLITCIQTFPNGSIE